MDRRRTDHDVYDLAFGPEDLVRRRVMRLPVPESQKITYEERREAKRRQNAAEVEEREQRILNRRERYAKAVECDNVRNEFLEAARVRYDEHIYQVDPHPRYNKDHARRPLKQTLNRMQAQYDSWVTNTDPHPRWRSERIVNLTFFGAMKTMREEQAAMAGLLGFETPEEES